MMKMLEAGGLEILTDEIREPDEDNPKGYYEFERVKDLDKDKEKLWLREAQGKGMKVISELLRQLPGTYFYKVIFMDRDLDEVISSQNKMLARRGTPLQATADQEVGLLFEKHLNSVKAWLDQQSNYDVIHTCYSQVLDDPLGQARRIKDFLGKEIDVDKMASAVDERLYRNRGISS